MMRIHCNFFSETLAQATAIEALIPQQTGTLSKSSARRLYPALYLLHGLSDDETIWTRRTSIERYVEGMGLAVIMPNGYRHFYTDTRAGRNGWQFLSQELPKIVRALFPISTARADTYVAGLSMGGYGAFKLALNQPERFAAAISLSGALDAARFTQNVPINQKTEFESIFGSPAQIQGGINDLFAAANKLAKQKIAHPFLLQYCGTEDYLLQDNRRFRDYAKAQGLPVTYQERPGNHTWEFWDRHIQDALKWLAAIR